MFQSNRYRRKRSFYIRSNRFHVWDTGYVTIPGTSKVDPGRKRVRSNYLKTKLPLLLPYSTSNYLSTRVVFDGKYWFARFAMRFNTIPEEFYSEAKGVDVGVLNFAATSDGKLYEPIWKKDKKYNNIVRRLKGLQKKLARQRESQKRECREEPSNRYYKNRNRLRSVGRNLSERKKAYKLFVAKDILSDNPETVVIENLQVKNMLKNKYLAPRIHEVGFYEFRMVLEHEQNKKQGKILVADTFFASSKLCSNCNSKKEDLSLSDRTYVCQYCGYTEDRDVNAAMNLAKLKT